MTDLDICPFCLTKYDTKIEYHIGHDITEKGEEDQHLEKCSCGAYRILVDVYLFEGTVTRYCGKWGKYCQERGKKIYREDN